MPVAQSCRCLVNHTRQTGKLRTVKAEIDRCLHFILVVVQAIGERALSERKLSGRLGRPPAWHVLMLIATAIVAIPAPERQFPDNQHSYKFRATSQQDRIQSNRRWRSPAHL